MVAAATLDVTLAEEEVVALEQPRAAPSHLVRINTDSAGRMRHWYDEKQGKQHAEPERFRRAYGLLRAIMNTAVDNDLIEAGPGQSEGRLSPQAPSARAAHDRGSRHDRREHAGQGEADDPAHLQVRAPPRRDR
jgi:hypothetical protein